MAVLIAHFLGIEDPHEVTALVLVVGAMPAIVTWCVEMYRGK